MLYEETSSSSQRLLAVRGLASILLLRACRISLDLLERFHTNLANDHPREGDCQNNCTHVSIE